MQSKTSFFSRALFKKNLSRTWFFGLLAFIPMMLGLPLDFIISYSNISEYAKGYTAEALLLSDLENSCQPYTVGFLTFACLMSTFFYLYQKKDNYMMHAFPISRKTLYFSGMLSTMTTMAVPVLITAVITTVESLGTNAKCLGFIWFWAAQQMTVVVFFVGFSLMIMMFTGQAVTAAAFWGLMNIIVMAMQFVFAVYYSIMGFGTNNLVEMMKSNRLTPMYGLAELRVTLDYNWDDNYDVLKAYTGRIEHPENFVIYLLAGMVFALLGYFLYKYKKNETVNDFISVPFLKPIFSAGVSFFVSLFFAALTGDGIGRSLKFTYGETFAIVFVSMLVYGVIIFCVSRMLIEKTFRVFEKKNIRNCMIYTCLALAFTILLRVDAFNVEHKIPEIEDVQWAGINLDYPMVFDDAEGIKMLEDVHKQILSNKGELFELEFSEQGRSMGYVQIKYKLKNGKMIERGYDLKKLSDDDCSQEYQNTALALLNFVNDPETIKSHVLGRDYKNFVTHDTMMNKYLWDDEFKYYTSESSDFSGLTKSELQKIDEDIYKTVLEEIDAGHLYVSDIGEINLDKKYYNDFSFAKKKNFGERSDREIFENDSYYDERYWDDNEYYSPTVTVDCDKLIQKFKEHGYINSDEDLVTFQKVYDDEGRQHREDEIYYQ